MERSASGGNGVVSESCAGGLGSVPSRSTIVRVRFCIDSSITSERTSIMAFDCSSEKPSARRRWTNFRVSKWWSRWREGLVEKGVPFCGAEQANLVGKDVCREFVSEEVCP